MEFNSSSLEDTKDFAQKLSLELQEGSCVLLKGNLGAGKTAIARGIVQALSPEPVEVTSPTFNILQIYDVLTSSGKAIKLYHYDLYRLEHEEELIELGFDENLENNITLIEWPEIVMSIIPNESIMVDIQIQGNKRVIYSS